MNLVNGLALQRVPCSSVVEHPTGDRKAGDRILTRDSFFFFSVSRSWQMNWFIIFLYKFSFLNKGYRISSSQIYVQQRQEKCIILLTPLLEGDHLQGISISTHPLKQPPENRVLFRSIHRILHRHGLRTRGLSSGLVTSCRGIFTKRHKKE